MNGWIGFAASALPSLLAIGARFLSDGRDESHVRRIKRYTDLLETVPEDAREPLETLTKNEVKLFAERQAKRSSRTLNGVALSGLILIGIVTALLIWGSSWLALNVHGAIWAVTAIVGIFGLAFMIAGVGQLYKYPGMDPE
ncbi:hypothetical protein HYG77_09850 [Rhodococcus sp. ZPP]|uniref:hypothetical protein n=1 Tax=Rhodococcus sp. ZPP TaxID=2749906 RepID=UPI001AD857F8|nr:hypothetical protein [Rhodococcus sp. ZPP]QTJ65867.1 hypothetical protein HYG77_09850 [Rhodococcus sp. ZPP]